MLGPFLIIVFKDRLGGFFFVPFQNMGKLVTYGWIWVLKEFASKVFRVFYFSPELTKAEKRGEIISS